MLASSLESCDFEILRFYFVLKCISAPESFMHCKANKESKNTLFYHFMIFMPVT